MALFVGRRVDVDLHETHTGIVEVCLRPLGGHEGCLVGHGGPPVMCGSHAWWVPWCTRGAHTSVQGLERDSREWVAGWNEDPRPYVWVKTADQILASLARYRARISDSAH